MSLQRFTVDLLRGWSHAIDDVSTDGGEESYDGIQRHLKHLLYPVSSVGPNKAAQG
ncbi:Hypothetical predicted protein [Scomber scombrus]|uniref:Uncharacterized protein n=1 Tax=Scomber scombrus TaxID=13677 RepID=A0AAV1NS85_SCOSC